MKIKMYQENEDKYAYKYQDKYYAYLKDYIEAYDFESNDFKTFLAVFPNSPEYSEISFEELLWKQLGNINKLDREQYFICKK